MRPRKPTKSEIIFAKLWEVFEHTFVLALNILSIWGIHWLFKITLGEDPKLFDRIPVRYIIDLAHLIALSKYIWSLIQIFRRKEEK
jgi:hypothetical protein